MKILRDLGIKISSFFSRVARIFVFSTLVSVAVSMILLIANLFAGVRVSIGFYLMILVVFDVLLTVLMSAYKGSKLFVPINKPLIMKLEQERIERARRNNRRNNKRNNKRAS